MPPNHHRYLLITRAGPRSLHSAWLDQVGDRGFDVLLSAYHADVPAPTDTGVFFEFRPGAKVAGYAEVLQAHADLISQYDYVALFDDDLLITPGELRGLFDIVSAHRLKIAQPALTHDSHFTFGALLSDAGFRLRFVNYIEMMCPIFRTDVLQEVQPLFSMGYESGIDLIWCNLVATSPRDFAVIDEICVRHTRPVGLFKAANGFSGAKRYEDDIYAVLAQFGLPWLSCVPFAGVRHDGSVTLRRSAFFLSSLRLVFAIGKGPGWRARARSIAVYWKHLIGRRAKNIHVSFAESVTL